MRADQRKFHYIYKITREDGKFYIGMHSTDDLDDGYFGSGQRLWKSINKHGKEKHSKEILEFLPDRARLKLRERELVNEDLLNDTQCMNLMLGGFGGGQTSPAICAIFSANAKKYVGAKNPFYGKRHTDVTRQKIRASRIGKPLSLETKQKLSMSLKGKKCVPPTIETKQKMRDAWIERRKRGVSNETREKMSAANRCKRTYELISPMGDVYVISALKTFCTEHKLSYSTMTACAKNGVSPCTGKNARWKIKVQTDH